jgi:SAM-dependent methyltransferase
MLGASGLAHFTQRQVSSSSDARSGHSRRQSAPRHGGLGLGGRKDPSSTSAFRAKQKCCETERSERQRPHMSHTIPQSQAGGHSLGSDQVATTPIPPRDLLRRTNNHYDAESDEWHRRHFENSGHERRDAIVQALPEGYDFEGRRVLDFGCGAGRVLRHFVAEAAAGGEFWGCDLYPPTIEWLKANLSPPFRFYLSEGRPLPHPDGHFDLIYAISVFTHITYDWSAWLLELHRILKPDGLLLATFIGPRVWERSIKRKVDEAEIGMACVRLEQAYSDTSGPLVLHSPWWLEEHWGRALEVVDMRPHGFAWKQQPGESWEELNRRHPWNPGHGVFVGRKKPVALKRDDLEWPNPRDPRELVAQRRQIELLEEDAARLRRRVQLEAQWSRPTQSRPPTRNRRLSPRAVGRFLRRKV